MNNEKIKLEVFESNQVVQERSFYIYDLVSSNLMDNPFKVIRSVCRKLCNYNSSIGVFENGKQIISTEEITNLPDDMDFSIKYVGYQSLDVINNKNVYEGYIRFLIREKLKDILIMDKYHKYSVKSDITSSWFQTDKGIYKTYNSRDNCVRLARNYGIRVEIRDDEKAYLWLNTKSMFISKITIMDLLSKNMNVCGLEVKNEWSNYRQSGVLTEVCDFTVTDPLAFYSNLKNYYIEKRKEAYLVENLPDDTRVVKIKLNGGSNAEVFYYPQALKPIITREYIANYDPEFSLQVENVVKRNMYERLQCDKEFINDIGDLEKLGGLSFERECCEPKKLGYNWAFVNMPDLVCGDNRTISCGKEYQVFNRGFYEKPHKKLKIGYLYPRGERELCAQVANDIYLFATKGNVHDKRDHSIKEGLLNIQAEPVITHEYDIGNITDYKRAALTLQNQEQIDIVIALIPDGINEESPYNPFKRIWSELNIPSQMVSMKTARVFARDAKYQGDKAKYYLYNIVLGILGKTGGLPWIVKDMPGNVDCFVGLDVATIDKGVHYPACSVVFDKYGRFIGFFKPRMAQRGEKINTEILQDIFDQVILSYEKNYGNKPKNIVIHRDGFSNEDSGWYEHYFKAQGIEYSIIEVRKNAGAKIIQENDSDMNPVIGSCVFNNKKAYLVSTMMKNRKGSPNPLIIEKNCGDVQMRDAIIQVLYLAQLHVGSTQKPRLPVTTGYADKICKNLDYVPTGQVENKLFFL